MVFDVLSPFIIEFKKVRYVMRFSALGVVLVSIACPTVASATQPSNMSDCVGISDNEARLACFDSVMKSGANPPEAAAPQTTASDATTAETEVQKKRRIFGLRMPGGGATKEADFGKRERPEDKLVNQITSAINSIEYRGKNAHRIELANGQIWQQLSSDSNYVPMSRNNPKKYSATIKEASFGSFKMTVEPMGRTIKVRRLQ